MKNKPNWKAWYECAYTPVNIDCFPIENWWSFSLWEASKYLTISTLNAPSK